MSSRIHDVRITVTGSDTEALLLEQSLIKALRPHYNIVLRATIAMVFAFSPAALK